MCSVTKLWSIFRKLRGFACGQHVGRWSRLPYVLETLRLWFEQSTAFHVSAGQPCLNSSYSGASTRFVLSVKKRFHAILAIMKKMSFSIGRYPPVCKDP
eukprot:1361066-Rhodomonas_salina.2